MQITGLTSHALPEDLPKWGIKVLESHHSHDFIMEWRRHPFLKIVYALAGSGTLYVDAEEYPFQAKDILIVPRNCKNRIVDSPSSPSSLYVLCLSHSLFRFDTTLANRFHAEKIRRSGYVADRVEELLRRLLFYQSNSEEMASLSMASAALSLLQVVLESSNTSEPKKPGQSNDEEMERYLTHLTSHFYEAQDLEKAARQFGISRRSFTQRFRKVAGVSWLEYVRTQAINHADNLLIETNAPIASVAFECGFADLSTFYRHFKAKRGMSPSAWRKDHEQ